MFKKILSATLAMAMVLSMAVAGSAASLTLGGKKTTTTSDKTTSSTTTTTTTTTSSYKGYDFCQTQLKNDKLALAMHNAFISGLRSYKNKITVSIKGYTEDEVYNAFQTSLQMIFDEHPEVFWLDPSMQNLVINSNHTTLTFYPRPTTAYGTPSKDGKSASTINTTAIKNTVTKMNNTVVKMTGKTTYDLIKSIHDTIINNTQYPANPDKATHNQHQAVGPLVEGMAVCDGYAKAFKYACDQKGIPCLIVVGTATNSLGQTGSHAWNYVYVDGVWYQVDTDWDDPQTVGGNSKSYLIYDYFMTGTIKNDARVKDSSMKYPTLSTTNYAK